MGDSTPPLPNAAYLKPGHHMFNTPLSLRDELAFNVWLQENEVPFDARAPVTDYDMRGFYKALQEGHPLAIQAVNPNDKQIHYPDYWKTPYHESFSNESQWALPSAPSWNDKDQLIDSAGNVVFDERARAKEPPQ